MVGLNGLMSEVGGGMAVSASAEKMRSVTEMGLRLNQVKN